MTVRDHIIRELENLDNSPIKIFRTSDIHQLSFEGKMEFGKYLGSPETYTREFRRLRTDGILRVKKSVRKGRQTTWVLEGIGKEEDHLDDHIDYSDVPF